MGKAKQYPGSPIMAAIHETADDLNAAGLMDKRTMRQFDEACLDASAVIVGRRNPRAAREGGGEPGGL